MLVKTEGRTFNGSSSYLNKQNLNSNSHCFNYEEEGVVEEIFKYVKLLVLDFSGVNFIENLHKNECVKDHCEKDSIFKCPSLIVLS